MFNKILPMTGVEPQTSGIESNRSTNWATTTSHITILLSQVLAMFIRRHRVDDLYSKNKF